MTLRADLVLMALAVSVGVGSAQSEVVAYPEDFRTWVHVKSGLVGPHSVFFESAGGLHHIYANEQAMAGFQSRTFPDGSVIVFDLVDVAEHEGHTTEGPRRRIDVMAKDSRRFSTTGGWGFERFLKDSKTERAANPQIAAQCFACAL